MPNQCLKLPRKKKKQTIRKKKVLMTVMQKNPLTIPKKLNQPRKTA